jgi:hypothetical protein
MPVACYTAHVVNKYTKKDSTCSTEGETVLTLFKNYLNKKTASDVMWKG